MLSIAPDKIAQALTYEEYRALVTRLLGEGKTTGPNQSPALLHYAELNEQRMDRIDKTFRLTSEASELLHELNKRPLLWLTLTEGWCGDASQIVPALNALAKASDCITLRLLLRDEHPDLMDQFLTNGSRSVPKVIFVDPADNRVLGSWGPRPTGGQARFLEFKQQMDAAPDKETRQQLYEDAKLAVHTWYARDKTATTQREVLQAALAAVGAGNRQFV
jgi:hypothetical protein